MASSIPLKNIPDVVLIIGTDAAGKDHVANIVAEMISESGGVVEKRKRFLSGRVTREASSTNKSPVELILEKIFLRLYPYLGNLLPNVLNVLLKRDLDKFRQPDKKLIIVGHNCLRGLAFHWGHRSTGTERIRVPEGLQATLGRMRSLAGFYSLVLGVDDQVREARIRARYVHGEADYFDRYMVDDPERSRQIDGVLVWLTQKYLNGQFIENNDLSEADLRMRIREGFATSMRRQQG